MQIINNTEQVAHPDHYKVEDKTYEPYKVIQAWEANFNIGSALKYLARYQKKWNAIEDLKKAKQYIDFEIERLTDMMINTPISERNTDHGFKMLNDFPHNGGKSVKDWIEPINYCDTSYACHTDEDCCKATDVPPKSVKPLRDISTTDKTAPKTDKCSENAVSDLVKMIDDAAFAVTSNKMSPYDALMKILKLDKNEAESILLEKDDINKMTEKIIDAVTNKFKTSNSEVNPNSKDMWW